MREKVGKSRNTVFFPMICGSGGSKSRLAKAAGAEPAGQMSDEKLHARRWGEAHFEVKCRKHTSVGPLLEVEMSKKCTPLWREAHFQVKMYKTHHCRTTFGSWNVEKVHAVVARSTFPSQNVQSTPCRTTLEVEMSKSARRWMYNTHQVRTTFGSWDVEKVHAVVARSTFPSQMYKTPHVRATFGGSDVEKVHAVVARSTFRRQNVQNTTCSRHFWRASLHYTTLRYIYTTLHYTTLHYTTLHSTTLQLQLHNLTTLHYINFHYATFTLHTFHYTSLHYTTLHYTTLHYTTLTTLQLQLHNYLHYTPLH